MRIGKMALGVAGFVMIFAVGSATAAPLLFDDVLKPDVMTSGINGGYSGGVFSLNSSLVKMFITPGSDFISSADSLFKLDAKINSSGNLVPDVGNKITISGTLKNAANSTLATGTALSADLTKFGFTGNKDDGYVFQFLFSNASGYLLSKEGFRSTGGIQISGAGGTFTGSFAAPFVLDSSLADADTFALAAPTPMVLPGSLVLLSGMLVKRRPRLTVA